MIQCQLVMRKPFLTRWRMQSKRGRLTKTGILLVGECMPVRLRQKDLKEDSLTQDGKDYSLTRLIMTKLHDASLTPNFQPIEKFFQDAEDNKLPNYAFLEPQFSGPGQNDQHPPSDIRGGEQLIADVYNAIRESDQWEKTLLVIPDGSGETAGPSFEYLAPKTI